MPRPDFWLGAEASSAPAQPTVTRLRDPLRTWRHIRAELLLLVPDPGSGRTVTPTES